MAQEKNQPREEKQVLTMEEIEFIKGDLQQNYEDLVSTSSLMESEKAKWKAVFNEFSDFYNNAPCGFHTIDDNGLIINMNQTELDWLGYKREEVLGRKNIMDLMSEKSGMQYYKEMPLLRDKGYVDQLEVEYVRKNGTVIQCLVSARAVFDENKVFKYGRSTVWDIADRKKMEDEMYKVNRHMRAIKQRFEEKNALLQKLNEELLVVKKDKTDFLDSLGLNVEQPLDKVLTLCNNLSNKLATPTPAELQKIFSDIKSNLAEVADFMTTYKTQQRAAGDSLPLQITKVNLSNLLVVVVNRLEEQATKKNLAMNVEIFEELWIQSDKELLAQLIDTLLSVSIKFTQLSKEVLLRLINKINMHVIEIDLKFLNVESKDFIDLFNKNKLLSDEPLTSESSAVLNSHLMHSLAEKLGYELLVKPTNHKGVLIRLAIPKV